MVNAPLGAKTCPSICGTAAETIGVETCLQSRGGASRAPPHSCLDLAKLCGFAPSLMVATSAPPVQFLALGDPPVRLFGRKAKARAEQVAVKAGLAVGEAEDVGRGRIL